MPKKPTPRGHTANLRNKYEPLSEQQQMLKNLHFKGFHIIDGAAADMDEITAAISDLEINPKTVEVFKEFRPKTQPDTVNDDRRLMLSSKKQKTTYIHQGPWNLRKWQDVYAPDVAYRRLCSCLLDDVDDADAAVEDVDYLDAADEPAEKIPEKLVLIPPSPHYSFDLTNFPSAVRLPLNKMLGLATWVSNGKIYFCYYELIFILSSYI
jgi:hypothetical protein